MILWNAEKHLYEASKVDLIKLVREVVWKVNNGADLNGLKEQKDFVDKHLEFSKLHPRDVAELESMRGKYGTDQLIKFLNRP